MVDSAGRPRHHHWELIWGFEYVAVSKPDLNFLQFDYLSFVSSNKISPSDQSIGSFRRPSIKGLEELHITSSDTCTILSFHPSMAAPSGSGTLLLLMRSPMVILLVILPILLLLSDGGGSSGVASAQRGRGGGSRSSAKVNEGDIRALLAWRDAVLGEGGLDSKDPRMVDGHPMASWKEGTSPCPNTGGGSYVADQWRSYSTRGWANQCGALSVGGGWLGIHLCVLVDGEWRVKDINLQNCGIKGPLPEVLGDLDHMFHLDLDGNMFTGPLPVRLGDLKHLEVLSLDDNLFTGRIPSTWGKLTQLRVMDLSDNMLEGPVPPMLANTKAATIATENNPLPMQQAINSSGRNTGMYVYGNGGLCGVMPDGINPGMKPWSARFEGRDSPYFNTGLLAPGTQFQTQAAASVFTESGEYLPPGCPSPMKCVLRCGIRSPLSREGLCLKFCGDPTKGDDLGEGQGELVDLSEYAEFQG